MARHLNTTHSFVNRVWRAHGLKPHLIRTFKLSNDPRFEEKLRDVVGLYLDPPHNAAVFSFDEKSQIQALDGTQPGLPMDITGALRDDDTRLQTSRYHHVVRTALKHGYGRGDRHTTHHLKATRSLPSGVEVSCESR